MKQGFPEFSAECSNVFVVVGRLPPKTLPTQRRTETRPISNQTRIVLNVRAGSTAMAKKGRNKSARSAIIALPDLLLLVLSFLVRRERITM